MDDPCELPLQSSEIQNSLPDVVHTQQIPAAGAAVGLQTEVLDSSVALPTEVEDIDSNGDSRHDNPSQNVVETTETESISEHIPSKIDYSTESDHIAKNDSEEQVENLENVPKHTLTIPQTRSLGSDNPEHDPSRLSVSWPLDSPAEVQQISKESPVDLAVSDSSKDSSKTIEPEQDHQQSISPEPTQEPLKDSHHTEYHDSLNEELSISIGSESRDKSSQSDNLDKSDKSSGSEDIIKLDIRGQGAPRFPLPSAKIIFGPPPEGGNLLDSNIEQIPVFQNFLSPFLVGAGDSVIVEEVFNFDSDDVKDFNAEDRDPSLFQSKEATPDKTTDFPYQIVEFPDDTVQFPSDSNISNSKDVSPDKSLLSDKEQDMLVEEVIVDHDRKEKETVDDISIPTQPKSMAPEDTMSLTTMTTDYKTICEEYEAKLVHFQEALSQRDELIEELTVSLQQSVKEREDIERQNAHLTREVHSLQHLVAESGDNTVKGQLSDFIKYENMIQDDSTKFYSAIMSGGSSGPSSNGEKDMDREEILVSYSRSDVRSPQGSKSSHGSKASEGSKLSEGSTDEFQTGFEMKLTAIIDEFDIIEENVRNQLRESIIQVLCTEVGKMRLEYETDIKELETQSQHDKQVLTLETGRLRELLANVRSGNVAIDALREELRAKHEREMESLRTYFERKCSDMERSYSEEVWRGRCLSPAGSPRGSERGGGDCGRPGCGAEPQAESNESEHVKQAVKSTQHLEDTNTEHIAYIAELQASHREAIAVLEEQIAQLKAHIQTAENTEANVSLYHQDIDLELEKRFGARLEQVRTEVVHELQEQIQVLLSDPDAEVSSWPLELVALRDKIQGHHDRELSSLREELSGGGGVETDKWKQRRNCSFDQNRQLQEVTRERDGLRRVAAALQRAVRQLVAYCASAEDELNRTLLARLLALTAPLHHDTTNLSLESSRPSTPNLSIDLNTSAVSRSSKHVHFAPDLQSILAELDEDGLVGFLQEQRDLSADIKRELELSLKRLRHEAHELLDLSSKLSTKSNEANMVEGPAVKITELVEVIDARQGRCDNCELYQKSLQEAVSESVQREAVLQSELQAALLRIAGLAGAGSGPDPDPGTGMETSHGHRERDLIAEGYGMLPPGPYRGSPRSLDGAVSPRDHLSRMAADLDAALAQRDDLQQQLEAANRQLRSTRQFVEEQASERECERDEFARRLRDLRDENQRLAARLHTNARILSEVEQLETQTREMTQIIAELESRKAAADEELKSNDEKVALLRDIIANLENQLEQKAAHEKETLQQLEVMKKTIDERDSKMRMVLGELESLRSERVDSSEVICARCGQEEDKYTELMETIKEQCASLESHIDGSTRRLEQLHEVCSGSGSGGSEPSEDVSARDRKRDLEPLSPPESARVEPPPWLAGVWSRILSLQRAELHAAKRVKDLEMQRAQLKDIAQEVRAERDVLQSRMSEQALRVSSLSARLQQQRNDAEALQHQAHSLLSVRLHDATAEVQRLREELESKDKQLVRLRQNIEERDRLTEKQHNLYGSSCNPQDKVTILERELSSAAARIAELESVARSLETERDALQAALGERQRALADREEQLQQLLALKLDEDNQKEEKSEIYDGGKTSARTLSDIVSISEFDEQDLQMRRAELKANLNLTGAPFDTNKVNEVTLPPEVQRTDISSLNLDYGDHFEINSPRADSLPAHLTSTQNKDIFKQYKRNVNETTVFGITDSVKHSTAQNIPDNCSLYPNRDVSDSKNISVEPKKINFSLEATKDNKSQDDDFASLKELGITIDAKQDNLPDILTQLKHEIKKSKKELETCKSELKNAEEQLCEFPALKEEVEELKGLLENTMATMENDKKFYENQLENFASNKKLLEQRLTELTQEVNDKSKDLHLLKEDILRRENMILELAKEKRNLTNKMTELEVKIDELQSRNNVLEKYEAESDQIREKLSELQRLQQLLSDKNHQIDSLNQHLDRLDDMQRCLNDKNEELENLKEAFEEKSNELFRLQDVMESLNQNVAQITDENKALSESNKDLKLKLTKLEKEQENSRLKLKNSESELGRVNTLNNELTAKIEEMKHLNDKLKDKETEIEILNEDMNAFHEEIATLKEQLCMVSRSPSPRRGLPCPAGGPSPSGAPSPAGVLSPSGAPSPLGRGTAGPGSSVDPKHVARIRKQVALLQHDLDFQKKELNDKVFELSKAKLDIAELKSGLGQSNKALQESEASRREMALTAEALQSRCGRLLEEKERVQLQLDRLVVRIREEGNLEDLKEKLRKRSEQCDDLEREVKELKELLQRGQAATAAVPPVSPVPGPDTALVLSSHRSRSPTAELERALRDQLDYSHTLDEDIMEQILSASSDEREDIPRLALNSKSSSIHSSTSERLNRVRNENERLTMQLAGLEARLRDKDALIAELNRIRDKLSSECQSVSLKCSMERDNAARLQLLLDTQKDTAETLQKQDASMIGILKKRLEASMQSELELQQREQQARARVVQLEKELVAGHGGDALRQEIENSTRLKSEISTLKSRLEHERVRSDELQRTAERRAAQAAAEKDAAARAAGDAVRSVKGELANATRRLHEASAELERTKEVVRAQAEAVAALQRQRQGNTAQVPAAAATPGELQTLRAEQQRLKTRLQELEAAPDEKDQALRYAHGRCLRLESCRKALVWQKRYLLRVLAGYKRMEVELRLTPIYTPRPNKRFKCVAVSVVAVVRMAFLVRRRRRVRALAAQCVCVLPAGHGVTTPLNTTCHLTVSTSPPTRDRPSVRPSDLSAAALTVPRRLLKQELKLNLPLSPTMSEMAVRRSPFASQSPRDEPFVLSSPRGEMAAAYLNKLELVSRCLNQAMDAARDAP